MTTVVEVAVRITAAAILYMIEIKEDALMNIKPYLISKM